MTGTEISEKLRSGKYTRLTMNDGTGVLVDVDGCHVLTLNRTGMFLVNAIERASGEAANLVLELTAEFAVDEETARSDVEEFLEELRRALR